MREAARRLHRAQHADLGAVAADQQRLARPAQLATMRLATAASLDRALARSRQRARCARMAGLRSGNTLAGFSSQPGSNADLMRRCWSSSLRGELHRHQVALLDADAVLAGQAAADLDAQLQDVGAEVLRLVEAVGIVGVEHDQRMQVAVAGVEDVGDLQAVGVATSRRCGAARRAGGWSG